MKKLNKSIALIFVILTMLLAFYLNDYLVLTYLIFILIPFIFKIKPVLTFVYLIYTFIAFLLGSQCELYQKTIWFDTFAHFLWGIVASLTAIYILDIFKMYNKKNIYFNMLFILIFTLATCAIWEVGEFLTDRLFGMNCQRVETGVYDTMKDIIIALVGNIIFLTNYCFEYIFNYNGIIKYILKKEVE